LRRRRWPPSSVFHQANLNGFLRASLRSWSAQFIFNKAGGASILRFDGGFCGVSIAVNYLEVWQAPIAEQIRPRGLSALAPNSKQRDTVVNFSAFPQPPAALAAAPPLQPAEKLDIAVWRVPKLPRDHAGAVPSRVHVSATVPQIDVPTEAIDRLAAHAAKTRTLRMRAFAIWRRWRSI
jgi:hypothetical protein